MQYQAECEVNMTEGICISQAGTTQALPPITQLLPTPASLNITTEPMVQQQSMARLLAYCMRLTTQASSEVVQQ